MNFKHKLFFKLGETIKASKLSKYYSLKNDERLNAPFNLIFFCGGSGLDYLNASLVSVYKYWKKLPDIYIVSDGTPKDVIKNGLIKWPRKVVVYSWQECAEYFKQNGNVELYEYASNELLGKKLVGIMYCAKDTPVLYADSDILWHNSPTEMEFNYDLKPQIKMSQDIAHFYTMPLLEALDEKKCLDNTPFNSGLVFLNGEFSSFPKWKALCKFLSTHRNLGWFTEQTSFAILNNYFNPNSYFKLSEVLIKVDDEFSLKSTKKLFPNILARHYVNKKATTFWRDFLYMFFIK